MKHGKLTFIIGISSLVLSSCASNYRRPESIEAKMARYKAHRNKHEVPKIKSFSYHFPRRSRGPASVAPRPTGLSHHSNKRLYFLTLLHQYNSFKEYINEEAPDIKHCPSFHTSMVNHNEKYKNPYKKEKSWQGNIDPKKITSNEYQALHPELFLPVTLESDKPRVIDLLKPDSSKKEIKMTVTKGIKIHISKTYDEIKELCEHGSSENYYAYENLITFIKREGLKASSYNMETLLGTTLFGNMALLKSLEMQQTSKGGRSIASTPSLDMKSQFSDELIGRLEVNWVNNYFNEFSDKRSE